MHDDEASADGDEVRTEEARGGRGDVGILGPPRGAPGRPLLEAGVLFAAQYLTAYLPSDASAIAGMLAKPAFYLFSMAGTLPGALLVLYMMGTTDGIAAFGIGRPAKPSLYRAALLAAASLTAMFGLGYLFKVLGVENPIFARGGTASPALVPLILAASAATGYGEELFFRAYLLRRLSQAGLSPALSIAASTLVFALAHGAQGIAGLATAGILGLAFAWRFSRGRDLHEVALGHAAYNAAVFFVELYA